jgi:hypothetical protein
MNLHEYSTARSQMCMALRNGFFGTERNFHSRCSALCWRKFYPICFYGPLLLHIFYNFTEVLERSLLNLWSYIHWRLLEIVSMGWIRKCPNAIKRTQWPQWRSEGDWQSNQKGTSRTIERKSDSWLE